MRYTIDFTGRKVTEHGIFYPICTARDADNPERAIAALYDEFEHISRPVVSGADGVWLDWGQRKQD